MGWFESIKNPKLKINKKTEAQGESPNTPTGVWQKCPNCSELLQTSKIKENFQVCSLCQYHFRLNAKERAELLLDEKTFVSFVEEYSSMDPLAFHDKKPYEKRLQEVFATVGSRESILAGLGKIQDMSLAIAIMEFKFMGGSMGVVCGEMIARTMEVSLEKKIPCVVVSSTGGARMQEGILSLMQMAKTSTMRAKLREAKIPYISILTDPTTGGCAASFSMLGDVIFAEPQALIGFAGPRVIEQSIRQTLPKGFQRSEFLLEKGFLDRVIHRHQLRAELAFFLKFLSP